MTDQKALQVVDGEIILPASTEIASSDLIRQISARLWKLTPNDVKGSGPYQLQEADMSLITETALSWGCNPLAIGNEYFAWKMQGKLVMMRHYAPLVAWAQTKEKFSHKWREWTSEEKEAAGIPTNDYVYDCAILTDKDEKAYQERYSMVYLPAMSNGVPFREALAEAERQAASVGTIGVGRVQYSEVYDDSGKLKRGGAGDVKGWIPGHDRAKIRALRDAIKTRFGSPSRNELMEMRSKALGVPVDQVPAAIADMPDDVVVESPEIQEYYRKIKDRVEQVKRQRALMSPQEREAAQQADIDLMRDPDRDKPIGEDPFPTNGIMKDARMRDILSGMGYEPQYHDKLSELVFSKSIQDLNELERHNLIGCAARRATLKTAKDESGNAIAVPVRIDRIPELSGKGISTRDEALKAVIAITQDLTKAGKKFVEFNL